MSTPQRIAIAVIAAVVIVGGFVIAKGSGDDDTAATSAADTTTEVTRRTPTAATTSTPSQTTTATAPEPERTRVDVVGGKPKGGIEEITVDKGDRVRFEVDSDVADEIHVHGYDLMKDVAAGGDVRFDFKATIEGKFEIELEDAGVQIAELTVEP